ncbi:MAG: hypothetical protein ACLP1Q_04865 [Solirubrobacteraceae bacterium]
MRESKSNCPSSFPVTETHKVLALLAVVPYLGSVAMYWFTASDLFGGSDSEPPSNWNWRFVVPVLVGGLTPLALAARNNVNGNDRAFLVLAAMAGIMFTIITMGVLKKEKSFFRIQDPIAIKRTKYDRLPRWRLIVGVGTLLLCCGAAANIVAAG